MTVQVRSVTSADKDRFLAAVRQSQAFFEGWVSPPATPEAFSVHLAKYAGENNRSYLAEAADGSLVGCINLNEIVRGAFLSAYMGYYAFLPNQGRGLMKEAMSRVIDSAFTDVGLHRLEANIQPENVKSAGLVRSLGFRLEGFSPRYLKIGGAWRDHERYAITSEEWETGRKPS